MIEIEGTLFTTSPLHITDASQDRRIESGSQTMPMTSTQTLTVVGSADEGGKTPVRRVPVIPSNSLRGRIRRAGVDVLMDAIRDRGEPAPNLPTYHTLCAGTADGRPAKGAAVNLDRRHHQMEHPFIGLFGGGPEMVESRFMTDTAWALVPETVENLDVPASCENDVVDPMGRENRLPLTQTIFFRRIDDVLSFSDPQASDRIENYREAAQEWLDSQRRDTSNGDGEENQHRDSSNGGGEENQRGPRIQGWNAMEVVLAGLPFSFRVGTKTNSNPVQDGLLLASMERFVERYPQLGG
ncbi:type IV CRISPR-associated protein Csf2, partial [Thioalkalivibrio sp. ALE23]|uniref:type IV CRISPR-associated protein Csf2 n=1 Tax=Thioalkalivibrio sp. ALE23 TaxID=1265495 RepID=UPI00047586F3